MDTNTNGNLPHKDGIPTNNDAVHTKSSVSKNPEQSIPLVDEKLVEKSKKVHEELKVLKERQELYIDAEMQARLAREQAGKDVAVAGAKVLEAVDTAQVAAQRLDEKYSAGTGARIDAVRAATNVKIAESEFDRKEREYREQQVRVSKLSLRSDILDLKAEIKTLEAESIDLEIAKSQLHGIGLEYQRRTAVENPTEEQQKDIETLEVLFEETKSKIERLETKMNLRALGIQEKEKSLSADALAELERDIASEEDEYLQYAQAARESREDVSAAVLEARKQEAKLVKELDADEDSDEDSDGGFLSKHKDSSLIKALRKAQHVKKEVLRAGLEILEKRIEDAEENIEAGVIKGRDTLVHEQTLEELKEAREQISSTKAAALAVETAAKAGAIGAEGFKLAGDAAGLVTDSVTAVRSAMTDLTADISRFIPYVGEALHIGLHIAAGVQRAAGHTLAGLERVTGETLRGEIRINVEGAAAEARMKADAAQLGLTDTDGLALSAGMRHGEVERTIAFDRIGHIMTETGERVAEDILDALGNAGIKISNVAALVGKDGLGNIFVAGIDNMGVFEKFGAHGDGLRTALGAFIGGEDLQNPLDALGKGTVARAVAEGFIGGIFNKLSDKGILPEGVSKGVLTALKSSRNAVKVQSDYNIISHEKRLVGDFKERAEVSKQFGYTHWFDQTGDREAAQRLAAQTSPNIRTLLVAFSGKKVAGDSADGLNPDEIAHSGNRGSADYESGTDRVSEGATDNGADEESMSSESATSMAGSGLYPGNSSGWFRSPYGSLIRLGSSQNAGTSVSLKSILKLRSDKAKKKVKGKRKRLLRILCIIVSLILLGVLIFQLVIIPIILAAIGSVVTSSINDNHWGSTSCGAYGCDCLAQFYMGGGVEGDIVAELGDGLISGTLEDGGIVTFNVPEVVICRYNGKNIQYHPQQKWQSFEYNGIKLDVRPPYDSDGLPFVIVGPKLLDPTTPDDSRIEAVTTFGGKPVYARLLIRESTGELAAVIARVNTNDAKAHTFNKYPAESSRYGSLLPYENVVTAGGEDLRPYVNDEVYYNIPSGLMQTGIAYPNSANAGGYIPWDGPWMPNHADCSIIEFNQKSAMMDFRSAHPNARLLQVQTSTDRALLESLALVEPMPIGLDTTTVDTGIDITAGDLTDTADIVDATIPADVSEDTTVPEGTVATTTASTAIKITCDCPLDCECWSIHGTENVFRSDGSAVGATSGIGDWRSTGQIVLAENSLRAKLKGMTEHERDMYLYGKDWVSSADTVPFLKEVTIKVWDFKSGKSGEKITKTFKVQVHEAIADEIVTIFDEIYADPEQFPIYEIGGFRAEGDYMHPRGLAFDINADENLMISRGVGKYWAPIGVPESEWVINSGTPPEGGDPYSIPPNGSVVRILKKYGWCWGGDAVVGTNWAGEPSHWTKTTDFMHFSICCEDAH